MYSLYSGIFILYSLYSILYSLHTMVKHSFGVASCFNPKNIKPFLINPHLTLYEEIILISRVERARALFYWIDVNPSFILSSVPSTLMWWRHQLLAAEIMSFRASFFPHAYANTHTATGSGTIISLEHSGRGIVYWRDLPVNDRLVILLCYSICRPL